MSEPPAERSSGSAKIGDDPISELPAAAAQNEAEAPLDRVASEAPLDPVASAAPREPAASGAPASEDTEG